MPRKDETENQANAAQSILPHGNALIVRLAAPETKAAAPFRIGFDEKDGNRKEDIGGAVQQYDHGLHADGFRQNNQRHDGLLDHLDPSLQRNKRIIGPQYSQQAP